MKRTSITVFAAVTIICVSASTSFTTGGADDEGSSIFGVQIPPGYRDWMLISAGTIYARNWERLSDKGLSGREASVPGRHNHRRDSLELRPVGGK